MKKQPPVRPARSRPRRPPSPAETLAWAIDACEDRKAVDGIVIDLRHLSDAADWFLVVSGTSDTHVRAIADHVDAALRERGSKPFAVEGQRAGRWVLLDYVDVVVHVFHPVQRAFYQLEGLWGDAPQRRLTGPGREV